LDSHDDPKEGGLSAAVLTDQADPVFLVDNKAGIPEQWSPTKLNGDILNGKHGFIRSAAKIGNLEQIKRPVARKQPAF
jgi:hypothetical protein